VKPAERFSNRVADYVRGRPGYPRAMVQALNREWTVAEVGAGTGIFTAMLLDHGCTVIAVEPNDAMREAAIERFRGLSKFSALAATAEATTLPDAGVDAVVAAQAFHWFDRQRFRDECVRVLKPGGIVALVWNVRRPDASRFTVAYEALIREFATDYLKVRHENVSDEEIAAFFGSRPERRDFDNVQVLDLPGLRARAASSSYLPGAGAARHAEMMAALDRLFVEHAEGGTVALPYDARLFAGTIR
jgi:SAM-dependent methyltransferase